jgi:membrane protein implicated in regulation of membrane protease activity
MGSKAALWASNTLRKHWFYLLVQLVALVIACIWIPYSALPAPGFAVAVIAVLAAAMSVHPDMLPWQKFVWLLLIGAFLFTELRAISKDKTAMDQKALEDRGAQEKGFEGVRQKQNQDFKATAKSLETAIGGIQSTLKTTNRELNSLENATWNFAFEMNCESEKIKNGCASVWNRSSTDRENGSPKNRNAIMIYPLLKNWPKELEDPNGTPLAWDFAFFREPKSASILGLPRQ